MTEKRLIILASILGLLGVALGAFGAHGLESTLEANGRTDTFQTASRYHMYHALALLGIAWVARHYPSRLINSAGYLIFMGTLIFSGSLYILAVADLGIMGAVAPIGGTALIIGWGLVGWAAWHSGDKST
ncbi:MAG: DUF423 domain-containing protein [Chloroflexota bacterium]